MDGCAVGDLSHHAADAAGEPHEMRSGRIGPRSELVEVAAGAEVRAIASEVHAEDRRIVQAEHEGFVELVSHARAQCVADLGPVEHDLEAVVLALPPTPRGDPLRASIGRGDPPARRRTRDRTAASSRRPTRRPSHRTATFAPRCGARGQEQWPRVGEPRRTRPRHPSHWERQPHPPAGGARPSRDRRLLSPPAVRRLGRRAPQVAGRPVHSRSPAPFLRDRLDPPVRKARRAGRGARRQSGRGGSCRLRHDRRIVPAPPSRSSRPAPRDAVAAWAASGAMALTGWRDRPALGPPAPLVSRLDDIAATIAQRSAELGTPVAVDPLSPSSSSVLRSQASSETVSRAAVVPLACWALPMAGSRSPWRVPTTSSCSRPGSSWNARLLRIPGPRSPTRSHPARASSWWSGVSSWGSL